MASTWQLATLVVTIWQAAFVHTDAAPGKLVSLISRQVARPAAKGGAAQPSDLDSIMDSLANLTGIVSNLTNGIADESQDAVGQISGALSSALANLTGLPGMGGVAEQLGNTSASVASRLNNSIQQAQDYMNGILGGVLPEATESQTTVPATTAAATTATPASREEAQVPAVDAEQIKGQIDAAEAAIVEATQNAARAGAAMAEFKLRAAEADRAAERELEATLLAWVKANETMAAGEALLQALRQPIGGAELSIGAVLNGTTQASKAAGEAAIAAAAAAEAEVYRRKQVKRARAAATVGIEAGKNFSKGMDVTMNSSRTAKQLMKELTSTVDPHIK